MFSTFLLDPHALQLCSHVLRVLRVLRVLIPPLLALSLLFDFPSLVVALLRISPLFILLEGHLNPRSTRRVWGRCYQSGG